MTLCVIAVILGALAGCGPTPPNGDVPPAATPKAPASSTTPSSAAEATKAPEFKFIKITDSGYSPASASIAVGTRVTWTNHTKKPRSVTFDQGPTSGKIAPDQSAAHVFSTAGTFTYHDDTSPQFKGTITVK